MKKRYGILGAIFVMLAVMFACGGVVNAATSDLAVGNNGTLNMALFVGDDGYFRPAADNLVDFMGQPVTVSYWSYQVSDEDVIMVDSNGYYKALMSGTTGVSIYGYGETGEIVFTANCSFTVSINMTNVVLDKSSIKGYICGYEGFQEGINIRDPDMVIDGNSEVLCDSSNLGMGISCWLENHVLYISCYSAGDTVLTVKINGKEFIIRVSVSQLEISKRSYVTSKGKKTKLKVKGTSDKPVWSSSDSSVAKVSSDGTVRCRRIGNAVITADFGGKKVGCAVSVISPKLLKVINRAKKIGSTWKYSQPKRMQTGYYDCSSLVWKSYSLMGKKFGGASYAPVAADIAKWCKQHGKVLSKACSYKQIQKMKFRPGDLMFRTGQNNGRYLGIYHVEMFTGYTVSYYDESGKPVLNSLWAARAEGYGEGGLMERP